MEDICRIVHDINKSLILITIERMCEEEGDEKCQAYTDMLEHVDPATIAFAPSDTCYHQYLLMQRHSYP